MRAATVYRRRCRYHGHFETGALQTSGPAEEFCPACKKWRGENPIPQSIPKKLTNTVTLPREIKRVEIQPAQQPEEVLSEEDFIEMRDSLTAELKRIRARRYKNSYKLSKDFRRVLEIRRLNIHLVQEEEELLLIAGSSQKAAADFGNLAKDKADNDIANALRELQARRIKAKLKAQEDAKTETAGSASKKAHELKRTLKADLKKAKRRLN